MPGLIDDGWELRDGFLQVPDTPGAGFDVDPALCQQEGGFSLSA